MSNDAHHGHALIESAREALDTVHRAALAADAGGLRRGLAIAASALADAAATELDDPAKVAVAAAQGSIGKALADLDGGALSEMEALIESARNVLAPV